MQIYLTSFNLNETRLEKIVESFGKKRDAVYTGLSGLDDKLLGFERGELIIVAGRPSMGKSSLATDMVLNISRENKVIFFSLEMSFETLAQRLLCNISRISYYKTRLGVKLDENKPKLLKAAKELDARKILIDDTSSLPLVSVYEAQDSIQKRLKNAKSSFGCVVIDYLQLLSANDSQGLRQQVTYISKNLKAIAKGFNVPVIALSQLSRAPEGRDDRRPRLSDLRESGSLEQDADKVLLLYRESYYDMSNTGIDNKAEIIIAKNRSGPTGTVRVCWNPEVMSFENQKYEKGTLL